MNSELLKSKKFRTAVIAALSSLLTFLVSKFGLNLNVDEIIALVTVLVTPFLIYIGAEGVSEIQAKKVVEENKVREKISEELLRSMIDQNNDALANEK
jgi:uncharacterized membrane protein